MAFPIGWQRRHKITIDKTKVTSGAHTDFPILLADGNFLADLYTNANADGSDLRFSSDEAGTTELAFEIVSFTPASSLAEVWVKIPSLASATDTVIYVWYGNAGASLPAANSTYGSQAVWSNGFVSVWHLDGLSDSTSTGYTLTNTGTTPTGAVKIKNGYIFDGSAQSLGKTSATALQLTSNLTYTVWAKLGAANTDYGIVDNDGGFRHWSSGGQGVAFYVNGLTTSAVNSLSNDTNLHHFAGRWNTSTLDIIVDKTKTSVSSTTGTPSLSSTIKMGTLSGGAWQLTGQLDESRIANVARSDGWLNTEYDNQNSPSTFSAGSDAGATITTPILDATTAATAITANTASSGGNVTADGGATVTARGICWSTSTTPIVAGSHTTESGTTGSFTSNLTGLVDNTLYYVRAYATNSVGNGYGAQVTFTTLATTTNSLKFYRRTRFCGSITGI